MIWIYLIIGLVVLIGLVYWIKSKKKKGGEPEMPMSSETSSPTGLGESGESSESSSEETSESSSSEQDRPVQ